MMLRLTDVVFHLLNISKMLNYYESLSGERDHQIGFCVYQGVGILQAFFNIFEKTQAKKNSTAQKTQ